jgi:hypothetical protein
MMFGFLVAAIVLVVAAAVAGPRARNLRPFAALAVLPLVGAAVMTLYVFSEDDYRDNGTTRWDAYRSPGGELDEMFVVSVALAVVSAAVIAYGALSGRATVLRAAASGAAIAVMVFVPTTIGFTAN